MKTASEFLEDYKNLTSHYADQEYSEDSMINALVAFASEHVKAALFEASKNAVILEESNWGKWENATETPNYTTHKVMKKNNYGHGDCTYEILTVDKNSILSSYPLDLIK